MIISWLENQNDKIHENVRRIKKYQCLKIYIKHFNLKYLFSFYTVGKPLIIIIKLLEIFNYVEIISL